MWETLLLEIMKSVVVPEVASFIRKRYEETGEWPTQHELELKVSTLAEQIKVEGTKFLDRKE